MTISIIAALDRYFLIGHKGSLPWHIPADLKYFREKTLGNLVVMGRTTYDSLGKALPNRNNIVLSRDISFKPSDCLIFNSVDHLLTNIDKEEEVFVIGGSSIYKQFLPLADKLYLTHIDHAFYGDSYFPKYDESNYEIISVKMGIKNDKNPYHHSFVEYQRKQKNTY